MHNNQTQAKSNQQNNTPQIKKKPQLQSTSKHNITTQNHKITPKTRASTTLKQSTQINTNYEHINSSKPTNKPTDANNKTL